eukprot:6161275-Heterocapsa_arctica.AAC.1
MGEPHVCGKGRFQTPKRHQLLCPAGVPGRQTKAVDQRGGGCDAVLPRPRHRARAPLDLARGCCGRQVGGEHRGD